MVVTPQGHRKQEGSGGASQRPHTTGAAGVTKNVPRMGRRGEGRPGQVLRRWMASDNGLSCGDCSFPGLATSTPPFPTHRLPGHSPHHPVLSPLLQHLELEPHQFSIFLWSSGLPIPGRLLCAGAGLRTWLIHSFRVQRKVPQEETFNSDSSCLLDSECHWGTQH